MLNVNPDTVRFIMDKAREFQAKEGVTIPEVPDSPSEDWARQNLADQEGDLTYQELLATINDLEPDQQIELVALMWLGRGDSEADGWDELLQLAEDEHNDRTGQYLIATPLLADFLGEGLYKLGYEEE